MERIYQMKVVPDVLPEINPGFDLRVAARNTALDIARTKKVYAQVEPGIFLKPEQVSAQNEFNPASDDYRESDSCAPQVIRDCIPY